VYLACLCGGAIGIERQQRIKAAGTRTHMVVALAAALMMITISLAATNNEITPASCVGTL